MLGGNISFSNWWIIEIFSHQKHWFYKTQINGTMTHQVFWGYGLWYSPCNFFITRACSDLVWNHWILKNLAPWERGHGPIEATLLIGTSHILYNYVSSLQYVLFIVFSLWISFSGFLASYFTLLWSVKIAFSCFKSNLMYAHFRNWTLNVNLVLPFNLITNVTSAPYIHHVLYEVVNYVGNRGE